MSLAQCPSYFKELDGIILPSLLECFSATPLEALIMGKPIFLSDRQFNKDVVGDFYFYFVFFVVFIFVFLLACLLESSVRHVVSALLKSSIAIGDFLKA